jgi:hypothetical protein
MLAKPTNEKEEVSRNCIFRDFELLDPEFLPAKPAYPISTNTEILT